MAGERLANNRTDGTLLSMTNQDSITLNQPNHIILVNRPHVTINLVKCSKSAQTKQSIEHHDCLLAIRLWILNVVNHCTGIVLEYVMKFKCIENIFITCHVLHAAVAVPDNSVDSHQKHFVSS